MSVRATPASAVPAFTSASAPTAATARAALSVDPRHPNAHLLSSLIANATPAMAVRATATTAPLATAVSGSGGGVQAADMAAQLQVQMGMAAYYQQMQVMMVNYMTAMQQQQQQTERAVRRHHSSNITAVTADAATVTHSVDCQPLTSGHYDDCIEWLHINESECCSCSSTTDECSTRTHGSSRHRTATHISTAATAPTGTTHTATSSSSRSSISC